MLATPLKTFVHPARVYRLEYPAHWDQVQQDEARSCGFGPHERDDVGLWISILPMSLDTDRLAQELPRLMEMTLKDAQADNLREDKSLRHCGLKADMRKEGAGGHYWLLAGGDVVLYASSQVPVAERGEWNPAFDRLMASLQITRDEELLQYKVAAEVFDLLQKQHPDQDFKFEEGTIRGKNRVVYLSNLFREVRSAPARRSQIVAEFVSNLGQSAEVAMGYEQWEDVKGQILPVLKPRDYIEPGKPTQHLLTSDWLADIVLCYVIKSKKFFRFVTGWDLGRWELETPFFHQAALDNLARLPWPSRLEGARQNDGSRVILVQTDDSLTSSRLLHPDLHKLFSGPLGSPFWAGIPDRSTLVLYSDRRSLKQRIARRLAKDYRSSAYPISPKPFLVTRDGIAPGDK